MQLLDIRNLTIELRTSDTVIRAVDRVSMTLKEGEMIVVKKGEQHKPFAFEECKVLIIEPRGVINTGDTGGDLTSKNDVWI